MHTLAAFYKSVTNGSVYDDLTAVTDQALTVSANGKYILRNDQRILKAHVSGINLSAARIDAPSLRAFMLPEIEPANAAATIPTRPPIVDYGSHGPLILRNEELTIEVSRAGADAQPVFGALWITDRVTPAPSGQQFTSVATGSNTLIAGQWNLNQLTFNQTLPAGEYAVTGLRVVCGDAAFARLVFPGQNDYRPGCTVDSAYTNFTQPDYFRKGAMGLLGKFVSTAQPSLEVFGLVAGAESLTAYIDLIRLR